jgi:molybdenum cofactor synthesis domain-containing protein
MEPWVAENAAALIIGNELLSGKVHEANLIELARTLRALGVELRRVVMLPDEVEVVAREVLSLSQAHDVVFTSGGVGPTHDDRTVEAIARAFGVGVLTHPRLAMIIQQAWGEACTEAHLLMARVPEGAELAESPEAEWPTPVMRNVFILPGVPEAFRSKLSTVRRWVKGPLPFVSRAAFTRLDESELKALLDAVVGAHPAVDIGSYPRWFEPTYKTKITFDGKDEALVESALRDFAARLPPDSLVRVE